jgi:hypothetical protein
MFLGLSVCDGAEDDVSDCGVCIGGYDGDPAELYDSQIVTARKPHECHECRREIVRGEKYERVTGRWEGEFDRFSFCLICSELSKSFSCDGRSFGMLWDDITDNLFPVMTTGCLNKLSTPEAKKHLLAKWAEWKGLTA